MFSLCSDCVADLIIKMELCLTVVSVLLKSRSGHTQNRYTDVENSLYQPLVGNFIINVFHIIFEASSITFDLRRQFFADPKIFEVERLILF